MKEIEQIRNRMIKIGMEKGFNHEETIRLSQELDVLIIKQMKSEEK